MKISRDIYLYIRNTNGKFCGVEGHKKKDMNSFRYRCDNSPLNFLTKMTSYTYDERKKRFSLNLLS